jgi:hypothetical protein
MSNPLTKLSNEKINAEVHRIRCQTGDPQNYVGGACTEVLRKERERLDVALFQQLQPDGTIQYKVVKGSWKEATGTGATKKAEAIAVLLMDEASANGTLS